MKTCNRLIVLKDGVVTDDCSMDGLTKDDIITKMVGRDVNSFFVHHDKQLDKIKSDAFCTEFEK